MIEQEEKSGDYGAAIRGDEQTVAWASQTDLGGTEAGRAPSHTINRIALTLGGVLMVSLILLCFRLAYDGIKTKVDAKGFTGKAYLDDANSVADSGPRAPVGMANSIPIAPRTAPLSVVAPTLPLSVPAPVNTRHGSSSSLFASEGERQRVADLLTDCRAAYDSSGELSRKWAETVGGKTARTNAVEIAASEDDTSAKSVPILGPHPLSSKEWDTIDTQIEAISATVGLATQPARYPVALQETSASLGREMRTFLQTERAALAQTDAQTRSQIQTRAEGHRQKAGQLLTTLESAIQTGNTPVSNPEVESNLPPIENDAPR